MSIDSVYGTCVLPSVVYSARSWRSGCGLFHGEAHAWFTIHNALNSTVEAVWPQLAVPCSRRVSQLGVLLTSSLSDSGRVPLGRWGVCLLLLVAISNPLTGHVVVQVFSAAPEGHPSERVAIKQVYSTEEDGICIKVQREITALQQLQHPSIVGLIGVGVEVSQPSSHRHGTFHPLSGGTIPAFPLQVIAAHINKSAKMLPVWCLYHSTAWLLTRCLVLLLCPSPAVSFTSSAPPLHHLPCLPAGSMHQPGAADGPHRPGSPAVLCHPPTARASV